MALSPVEQRRIASLEAKIAALERLTRPASGIGQGSSTLFGSLNIRSTQLGFAAELTSTFNATTGYNWKRLALDTTLEISLTNPAIQPEGTRAYEVTGNETLGIGDRVWLEPSPEAQGYLFAYCCTGNGIRSGSTDSATGSGDTPPIPSYSFWVVTDVACNPDGSLSYTRKLVTISGRGIIVTVEDQ